MSSQLMRGTAKLLNSQSVSAPLGARAGLVLLTLPHQQSFQRKSRHMAFSIHDLSQSHFMTVANFNGKYNSLIYDLFTSFHSLDHASLA